VCVRQQACIKEGGSAVSGRCCAGLTDISGKCGSVAKFWSSSKLTVQQKCSALGGRWVNGSGVCVK
jgi:hypothetical protein